VPQPSAHHAHVPPGASPRPAAPGHNSVNSLGLRHSPQDKHIDDLGRLDMNSRTAAERVTVKWLKERVVRRKLGADAPPIPVHLR
jgi:hypothetical protein